MLDVFKSDAFSLVSLTDAINKLKFVPGRIGQMGLFQESGVSVTNVAVEEQSGILKLVAPTPRGGPGITMDKAKRTLRVIPVPKFEINDAVMAEEVQGIRSFGSETAVDTVMAKVAERLQAAAQSIDVTHEYSRIGAIIGVVTYADATTMSLFTTFGVSQIAEVDFDLDNATPLSGALRKKCASVVRLVATELGGVPFTGLYGFCGDAFWDDLIAHPEVRATYLQTQAAADLRTASVVAGQSYGSFTFGGITFENYRGSVDATSFINTDKCHIFPVGVPGLFRTYYAPADYNETVNTMGVRLYAKQYEMPNDKGIFLDSQSNALHICTRPRALILSKRT